SGGRNETAKDERDEHDHEAGDAPARIVLCDARHVHPPRSEPPREVSPCDDQSLSDGGTRVTFKLWSRDGGSSSTAGSPCGAGSRCAQWPGETPSPDTQCTSRPHFEQL